MVAAWKRWRRRRPSRLMLVETPTLGSTIVAAGLRKSRAATSLELVPRWKEWF